MLDAGVALATRKRPGSLIYRAARCAKDALSCGFCYFRTGLLAFHTGF